MFLMLNVPIKRKNPMNDQLQVSRGVMLAALSGLIDLPKARISHLVYTMTIGSEGP